MARGFGAAVGWTAWLVAALLGTHTVAAGTMVTIDGDGTRAWKVNGLPADGVMVTAGDTVIAQYRGSARSGLCHPGRGRGKPAVQMGGGLPDRGEQPDPDDVTKKVWGTGQVHGQRGRPPQGPGAGQGQTGRRRRDRLEVLMRPAWPHDGRRPRLPGRRRRRRRAWPSASSAQVVLTDRELGDLRSRPPHPHGRGLAPAETSKPGDTIEWNTGSRQPRRGHWPD